MYPFIWFQSSFLEELLQSTLKLETKIFRKANIYYPLIRKRTYAYQGIRCVSFSENFANALNAMIPYGVRLHKFIA